MSERVREGGRRGREEREGRKEEREKVSKRVRGGGGGREVGREVEGGRQGERDCVFLDSRAVSCNGAVHPLFPWPRLRPGSPSPAARSPSSSVHSEPSGAAFSRPPAAPRAPSPVW